MNLLALDTSSTACSVALLANGNMNCIHRIMPLQQAQAILPMIDEVLHNGKTTLNQLDAIAFGCGPGSFTGVRIAAGVTQGLAYALQLPVIAISSLAALAQAAYQDLKWEKFLVGVDARINEVYWGAYVVNEQGLVSLIGKEMVCPPSDVVIPRGNDWYGVGNAWEIYTNQMPYQPIAIDTTRLPMAAAILELAKVKYQKQEWVNPKEALPVYLRDTVAIKSRC